MGNTAKMQPSSRFLGNAQPAVRAMGVPMLDPREHSDFAELGRKAPQPRDVAVPHQNWYGHTFEPMGFLANTPLTAPTHTATQSSSRTRSVDGDRFQLGGVFSSSGGY